MVQILPILAAATLLAQSAFGAAVPVKRTNHEVSNNQHESNQDSNQYNQYNQEQEYNQDSNQYAQQNNQYEQNQYQNQYENQYEQQNNQYEQQNNQYENQYQNQYEQQQQQQHEVTTTEQLVHELTSTAEAHAVETTVLEQQYNTEYNVPSYGSGSSNWNGYNDCVSTCMAQFGAPPSAVTMDHENMPEAAGTGAIHTVMVAPDGVGLRYVPFAVNASIGDTIRYVWTTNANHTVTLSSALTICNKSALAEERNFASGVRSAAAGTQTFDVVVETEEPQFFYCSVAQHCVKGMFGVINPGSDNTGANTVRSVMANMLDSNPQLQAANEWLRQNVTDRSIQNWGNDISLDGFTEEQMTEVISNVMYTRAVFGANPGMLELGEGAATPDGSPIMIPQGLNVLLSNTNLNAPATTLSLTGTATSFPTPTGTGTIVAPLANGAFSVKGGASVWAAAFVGVLGYLLI